MLGIFFSKGRNSGDFRTSVGEFQLTDLATLEERLTANITKQFNYYFFTISKNVFMLSKDKLRMFLYF